MYAIEGINSFFFLCFLIGYRFTADSVHISANKRDDYGDFNKNRYLIL